MELTANKFKKTEFGEIPEDWQLVPLDKLFSFHSTSNFSKAQMSEDGEVGCMHYGLIHAIHNTQYDLTEGVKYYVKSEEAKYERIKDGDVIMVDASEDLDGINKSVEVFGVGDKNYISGLHTYLLRDKDVQLADGYRGLLLNSDFAKKQMLQLAVGMKVFGVSKTQLVNVNLPIPPTKEEQQAIAEVLTDTDKLIQALEKKIAKKKLIKKGVMQQLLKPKEGWVKEALFSFVELSSGQSPSKFEIKESGIPYFKVEQLNNSEKYTGHTPYHIDSKIKISKGSLIFPKRGASIFQNKIRILNEDSYMDTNLMTITVLDRRLNNEYLYYQLREIGLDSLADTTSVPQINNKHIYPFEIPLPETLEEQIKIAEIASDMDKEIEILEQKLSKYKLAKQGMMQQLLTGKIRLA